MSAQGVYTRNKRFTFVKGEVTTGTPADGFVACGDGTAFSMEVTGNTVKEKLDKIAEVFHRVKDATITQGRFEVRSTPSGAPYSSSIVRFTDAPKSTRLIETEESTVEGYYGFSAACQRGYSTSAIEADPMVAYSGSFLTLPSDLFPFLAYDYDADSYVTKNLNARYAVNERSIFASHYNIIGCYEKPIGGELYVNFITPYTSLEVESIATGFSYVGGSSKWILAESEPSPPTIYVPYNSTMQSVQIGVDENGDGIFEYQYGSLEAGVSLSFLGRVAFTGVTPYDPDGKLFIEIYFFIATQSVGGYSPTTYKYGSTINNYSWVSGWQGVIGIDTGISVKLKLSGENNYLSAKIYSFEQNFLGSFSGFYSGEDWIFEATEWWPYAQSTDPSAVWDANTGERLPAVVIFAAFDREDQQDQIFHLI